ncbi:MAG: energy-coupled thiamine transporter ThiT [Lachnospiraceae bacterium]|nr:energy-coupled thiamine transporter ThiT [Lachnospiraceae bacterium]
MTILQNKLTKILAFSGMALALGYVASYIKIASLPMGGSTTLLSMLFICLIGYWYGLKVGLMAAVAYGILQFLQRPIAIHPMQPIIDYILAFGALGLSGIFKDRRNGLIIGYLVAVFCRFFFHFLSGLIFFTDYTGINFAGACISSFTYNMTYILPEVIITVVILILPPVKAAMNKVKELSSINPQ